MTTPTPPNMEREAKSKLVELIGVRCRECNEDCFACQMWAAIDAYVEQAVKEADRKTLETVAALSTGGSSPENALSTIRNYVRNKLLVLNGKATPHQKEEGGE